jgi:tryptophan-rich sensory protein
MKTLLPSQTRGSLPMLIGFLVVVIAVGALIGALNTPGAWFAGLAKPAFQPPNWLFAPVWLILYVLIAIAGWRTFNLEPKGREAALWVLQMVLNWLWSPVFFTLHALWLAFVIIALLLLVIVGFMAVTWNRDRTTAALFIPYALWVAFATVLNFAIARLN